MNKQIKEVIIDRVPTDNGNDKVFWQVTLCGSLDTRSENTDELLEKYILDKVIDYNL